MANVVGIRRSELGNKNKSRHGVPQEPLDQYYSRFTFSKFAHLVDDAPCIIHLTPHEVRTLREVTTVRLTMGRVRTPEDEWHPTTLMAIEKFIAAFALTGVFAKVADASPKDAYTPRPIRSIADMWDLLTSSRRILGFLESTKPNEGCDLVLRPFDARIRPENEYRVFILNGTLVGISQQHLYDILPMTPQPHVLFGAITNWLTRHSPLPWIDVVLDVFVDNTGTCHLIEVNPGAPWASTGSALFTWDELIAFKHGLFVEIRYLCA